MNNHRADLHMHGPIGFQPYWLRKQGYAGKNLLQLIADECFRKGITICAITSQEKEIPKNSVHDRLGCLKNHEAQYLPQGYQTDSLGENILVVEKGSNRVYLVNGQTVMPEENGKKYDLLVVGSNQIPNAMSFNDTLNYGKDHGLIQIAEHPYIETHRGIGEELLEEHIKDFDAIEGHNSQAIFSSWTTRLPVVGGLLSRAGKEMNEKARQIACRYNKPWIATSDAHRIEDLGISHIQWESEIDDSNETRFFGNLKTRIHTGAFKPIINYEKMLAWFSWISTFQKGIRSGRIKDEYIPSYEFKLAP